MHTPWLLVASAVAVIASGYVRAIGVIAAVSISIAFFFGGAYYIAYFALRDLSFHAPIDEEVVVSGFVSESPAYGARSAYFAFELAPPLRGTVRVFAPRSEKFKYGESLLLSGTIEKPENEREVPRVFFPKIEKTGEGEGAGVKRILFALKERLIGPIADFLPPAEAAFLAGITLGAKADFPPDLLDALARSGTTHLVALSGYNVAILVMVLFGMFAPRCGRRSAFYVTSMAIAAFVVMVGAEDSIVRAGIMGFLALLATHLGRPYALPQALLWTATAMTLWNPGALFAPGFQLSFMALLGIVYVAPAMLALVTRQAAAAFPAGESIRESAILTIAAQVAVLPVLIGHFGEVSIVSIPANILILPFMPLTMLCGFLLLGATTMFPPAAAPIAWIAHALLAYEIGVIRWFGAFPAIKLTMPLWSFGMYYACVGVWAWRYFKHSKPHA